MIGWAWREARSYVWSGLEPYSCAIATASRWIMNLGPSTFFLNCRFYLSSGTPEWNPRHDPLYLRTLPVL
jgi:hypothetical protein